MRMDDDQLLTGIVSQYLIQQGQQVFVLTVRRIEGSRQELTHIGILGDALDEGVVVSLIGNPGRLLKGIGQRFLFELQVGMLQRGPCEHKRQDKFGQIGTCQYVVKRVEVIGLFQPGGRRALVAIDTEMVVTGRFANDEHKDLGLRQGVTGNGPKPEVAQGGLHPADLPVVLIDLIAEIGNVVGIDPFIFLPEAVVRLLQCSPMILFDRGGDPVDAAPHADVETEKRDPDQVFAQGGEQRAILYPLPDQPKITTPVGQDQGQENAEQGDELHGLRLRRVEEGGDDTQCQGCLVDNSTSDLNGCGQEKESHPFEIGTCLQQGGRQDPQI